MNRDRYQEGDIFVVKDEKRYVPFPGLRVIGITNAQRPVEATWENDGEWRFDLRYPGEKIDFWLEKNETFTVKK